MIDVKKLVTGFLILAIVAGASALFISLSFANGNSVSAGLAANAAATSSQSAATPLTGSAFLPQQAVSQSALQRELADSLSTSTASSSDNLTDDLASALLVNVASANPNGPQVDANGDQVMTTPDENSIAEELASSSALQNFQIPDWDLEAGEQPINVVASSSPQGASYASGLAAIFNTYFVQNNLESDFAQGATPDPSVVNTVASSSAAALSAAISLPTPTQAAAFQKSFVALLVYQKNMAELMENANTDPVKTQLIVQAETPRFNAAVQNFEKQFQDLSGQSLSLNGGGAMSNGAGAMAFVNSIFGIQTAHAQWAVFDVTEFLETVLVYTQEYATYILEWTAYLNSILLQTLKNTFVVAMESQITKWIQGGGNPRFVTNWGQTFAGAFNAAANGVVTQTLPNLSPSFSGEAGTLLQDPSDGDQIDSNIDQEYSDLGTTQQDFYNDWDDGGMAAYLDLFQPDNNLFGAVMDTQDEALNAATNQYSATQAKDTASNGFTGDEACSDGSELIDGYCPYDLDDTEPIVSTPGETTAQGMSTALGSGVQLVVNANNTFDLLFAVAQNILSLISTGSNLVNAKPPATYTPSNNCAAAGDIPMAGPNGITVCTPPSGQSANAVPPAGVTYPPPPATTDDQNNTPF